jgi:hypothetical protein
MGASPPDPVDAFRSYLERFEQTFGPCEFGTYVKHKHGRPIKKLTYDEFEEKWNELAEVNQAYEEIVANGDTINDVLVKVLRERCDDVLFDRIV